MQCRGCVGEVVDSCQMKLWVDVEIVVSHTLVVNVELQMLVPLLFQYLRVVLQNTRTRLDALIQKACNRGEVGAELGRRT